jgi:Flp pilus assembly protein TadG
MKAVQKIRRHRRHGQSLVEFALGGFLLMMLLAAAVDLGRVFYVWIVVQQMAGEGAAIISILPDNDITVTTPAPVAANTFQRRAEQVAARTFGQVQPGKVNDNQVHLWDASGVTIPQSARCTLTPFRVTVDYQMQASDLFFPGFLGFTTLQVSGEEDGKFVSNSARGVCPP